MQHRVWEIKKERLIFVVFHKGNGLVRIKSSKLGRISRALHDLVASHERYAAGFLEMDSLHRIEVVQQTEVFVEPLTLRQERLMTCIDYGRTVSARRQKSLVTR